MIRVSPDGLVLTPDHFTTPATGSGEEEPTATVRHLRIPWGKEVVVEEVEGPLVDCEGPLLSVHGLVGFLQLFQCEFGPLSFVTVLTMEFLKFYFQIAASYLLVITNRCEVGNCVFSFAFRYVDNSNKFLSSVK